MMARAGKNDKKSLTDALTLPCGKNVEKILKNSILYPTMILQVPGKNSRTVGTELTFECKNMKIKGLRITLSQSL